jgi:agmatinase
MVRRMRKSLSPPPESRRSVPPRSEPADDSVDPAYTKIPSFFGLPRHSAKDAVPPVDVLLTGLPYDGGALYRSGGRYAPRAVRDASSNFGTYSDALGIRIEDQLSAADGGDVPVSADDIERALEMIATRSEAIARSGVIGGFVGGDQTVTLGVLRGINRAKLKAVGLVHIDSRTDTQSALGQRGIHQHSVIRNAVEEGLVRPDFAIQVGIRGPHESERESQFAGSDGFEIVKIDDVKWDLHAAVSQIRKVVREGSIYVSVDVSVLDPAHAPGASAPRPGGMNTWELQQMLRALVGAQIVGFDVVEVVPSADPSGITALAGASVLHELLAVIADTQRSSRSAPSSVGKRRGRRLSP